MKAADIAERASDDAALVKVTGRNRKQWFELIDGSGATGRAAIGKLLLAEKLDPWWAGTLVVDYENARAMREKDGRPKGYSLCMTKTVAAPAARVYQAFVDAAELSAWFGPGTSLDATVGGELHNRDGNRATVLKLRPEKALVLRWDTPDLAPGTEVEVLFQPKADKCGIVVNHTRVQTRREADLVRSAWDQALVRLKQHLER